MIPHPSARIPWRVALVPVVALALLGPGCEVPACIDGPSNLTPEATAACDPLPDGVALAPGIKSAAAQRKDDGTLFLTWSSWSLTCGVDARDFDVRDDCDNSGWAITVELPVALQVPGVIVLADHPELVIRETVVVGGDGGQFGAGPGGDPFVGEIELVQVGEGCLTGVLRGFGSGHLDPGLGGPELDGGFVAPRC
ncbi:MAG: hypothetical protein R3B09_27675 [Nannocystaceae bacterium]